MKIRVWVAIESMGIGGAERAMFDVVSISSSMFDWTVWVRSGAGIHAKHLPDNVRVLACSTSEMMSTLKREKPDVFINNIVHELIALTPEIAKSAGMVELIMHSPHPWSLQFVAESVRDLYDRVILVADYEIDHFVKAGVHPSKIRIMDTFIDQAKFVPTDGLKERRAIGVDSNVFLFGYAGRADGGKRVNTMPAILRGLLDHRINAKMVLVGLTEDGQGERTAFWDSVRVMMLDNAKKHGVLDNIIEVPATHDMQNVYPALDATILPSLHEGSPLMPIESLACGVPCVATDVGDLSKYLLPCTGSAVIRSQDRVEPLFAGELFRIAITSREERVMWARNAVDLVTNLRSSTSWEVGTKKRLEGILL